MNVETVLIYEPDKTENYYPFSIMHCIWEIRCGALRIFEKINAIFPDRKIVYYGRKEHLESFLARTQIEDSDLGLRNTLAVDGSVIPAENFYEEVAMAVDNEDTSILLTHEGEIIGGFFPSEDLENDPSYNNPMVLSNLKGDFFSDHKRTEIKNVKKINYLWDAIYENGKEIEADLTILKPELKKYGNDNFWGAYAVNPDNIYLGENIEIMPGTVLDSSEGPIILGDNVTIMSHSAIIGPCYIGDHSTIKIGAKIYEDCSFGEHCKVGGEIENTIIHAFSNKQHGGFLGHSYISEWVNLGAGTNNSDLKNTYGNIKIMLEENEIDTGRMFLGLLCGDHTKSAINTEFNTGTVAGICGILVYEGFHPRFIKSYSWGGRKDSPHYHLEKAKDVARKVMERRDKELLPAEEKLMEMEYEKIRKL